MDTLSPSLIRSLIYLKSDDIVSLADDNDEKRYIIKIPYVGTLSHEFKNKIITFFNYELKVTVSPVFNTFKFQIISLLNHRRLSNLWPMSFTSILVCVIQTSPILVKLNDIWE